MVQFPFSPFSSPSLILHSTLYLLVVDFPFQFLSIKNVFFCHFKSLLTDALSISDDEDLQPVHWSLPENVVEQVSIQPFKLFYFKEEEAPIWIDQVQSCGFASCNAREPSCKERSEFMSRQGHSHSLGTVTVFFSRDVNPGEATADTLLCTKDSGKVLNDSFDLTIEDIWQGHMVIDVWHLVQDQKASGDGRVPFHASRHASRRQIINRLQPISTTKIATCPVLWCAAIQCSVTHWKRLSTMLGRSK